MQSEQIDQSNDDTDEGQNDVILDQQGGVEADQQNADNAGGEFAGKQSCDPIVYSDARADLQHSAAKKTPWQAEHVPKKLGGGTQGRLQLEAQQRVLLQSQAKAFTRPVMAMMISNGTSQVISSDQESSDIGSRKNRDDEVGQHERQAHQNHEGQPRPAAGSSRRLLSRLTIALPVSAAFFEIAVPF